MMGIAKGKTKESLNCGNEIGQPDWSEFRQQMPVARKWSYLDHAAVAPLPDPTWERIRQWGEEAVLQGDTCWLRWRHAHEECRCRAAELINARESEIALIPNTTFGINLVAQGLPWEPGDNVVLPQGEFPSNVYPWMSLAARGVELRQIPLDENRVCLERVVEACDARTRLVSASWVGFASGYRIDPVEWGEAVHQCGALFFLDAIQGLGVFPIDVNRAPIDFLAADGHKWLLGPEGAGLLFVRSKHLNRLQTFNVGWNSVAQGNDYNDIRLDLKKSAARHEGGTQNMAGFIGLGASLDLLTQYGLSPSSTSIADRVLAITDRMCDELQSLGVILHSPRGAGISSGIILFEVPGTTPLEVRQELLQNHVVVSCRGGHVRAAVHAYNDENDLDRLLESVKLLL